MKYVIGTLMVDDQINVKRVQLDDNGQETAQSDYSRELNVNGKLYGSEKGQLILETDEVNTLDSEGNSPDNGD